MAHFGGFRLSFDKFIEDSFFLRNRAFLEVTTRKNRSFCGMGGVISPLFWHIFESRSFCGTEARNRRFWRNLLPFCETRRTAKEPGRSPDFSREGFRKCFENDPHTARSARRSVSMSCEGARTFTWLRGNPPVRTPVLWLPRSSCSGLPRSSSFASFCGRKRFSKIAGLPPSWEVSKFVPPRAPTGYIYIHIYAGELFRCPLSAYF